MLRPERMSKVSVTGSIGVMEDVIETLHEQHLVHLSDYDGSWEGFDNGTPVEGGEAAAERLVTVRAIESTLDLDDEHEFEPDDELPADWEDRLESLRTEVNQLDDRRAESREELRSIRDRIDAMAPFEALGLPMDLLWGYDHIEIVVGEGDEDAVVETLEDAEGIRAYETFVADDVVAIAAAPEDPTAEGVVADALIGVQFQTVEVPEIDDDPAAYISELEADRNELDSHLETLEHELEALRRREAGFVLALEEALTVEVDRAEAPLQFATTERAFVAEGWIPEERVEDLETALRDAVGDRVEFAELFSADYDAVVEHHDEADHGAGDGAEAADGEEPVTAEDGTVPDAAPESDPEAAEQPIANDDPATDSERVQTDGGSAAPGSDPSARSVAGSGAGSATTDGGETVTLDDDPPVVLDNVTPAKPFELMVKMVNQPKYSELDPTLLVFLTFPFAFGFMIGDIGYGILYMAMGWLLWRSFDSSAGRALGTIAIWAGVFTIIFGYLYDDIFGVHMADLGIEFLPLAGSLDKGLQLQEWALLWIIVSILFGLVHLNMGLILGFVNELHHGLKAAVLERFSWILLMNGLFVWIFSTHAAGEKPGFLVGEGSIPHEFVGFTGLPEVVGLAGLGLVAVGFVMVLFGEGIAGAAETPAWAFGHVLSYLRMVAVLLAKGGMAFVVNLLVFGGFEHPDRGYIVFGLFESPASQVGEDAIAFEGLIWLGLGADMIVVTAIALLAAVLVFILGHILVLLLGITAAGIQMLRLEYVEFFQKFYEGGGEEYDPFGRSESRTTP